MQYHIYQWAGYDFLGGANNLWVKAIRIAIFEKKLTFGFQRGDSCIGGGTWKNEKWITSFNSIKLLVLTSELRTHSNRRHIQTCYKSSLSESEAKYFGGV